MDIHDRVRAAVRPERVVEIARALCSLPSPLGEEGAVGALVARLLHQPGIEVQHEDVVAGRPNVIATVRGAGERPPLVLNGHLDATVHLDGWSHDPFDPWVADGCLYGGGITDMKGAVAAMIAATEAAAALGGLPGDLILQAVMHHDGTGLGTKYALASDGPEAGFAICGEPSELAIHTSNGGAVKFEIELHGRSAHICRAEEGIDTLPAALAVYAALGRHAFSCEPHPRLPDLPRMLIGQLVAGSSPAHVPARAVLRGDVRTVPGLGRDAVRRQLAALVDDASMRVPGHAGAFETAVVRALRPDLIQTAVVPRRAGSAGQAPDARIRIERPGALRALDGYTDDPASGLTVDATAHLDAAVAALAAALIAFATT